MTRSPAWRAAAAAFSNSPRSMDAERSTCSSERTVFTVAAQYSVSWRAPIPPEVIGRLIYERSLSSSHDLAGIRDRAQEIQAAQERPVAADTQPQCSSLGGRPGSDAATPPDA